MRIRYAIIAVLIVLGFHALGMWRYYDWYFWYDVPMHLFGGVAMGIFALWIWDARASNFVDRQKVSGGAGSGSAGKPKKTPKTTPKKRWDEFFIMSIFVLGFVALIGILWELHEYAIDIFVAMPQHLAHTQTSIGDTMDDFVNDLAGGAVVMFVRSMTRRV